jgi:subtilisin family serine protease
MRFRGKDYTGKGVTVALVDSGVDVSDPRNRPRDAGSELPR